MSDFDDRAKQEPESPWEHKTTAEQGKGGTLEATGGAGYTHTSENGNKLKGSVEGTFGKGGKEKEKEKKKIAELEAGVELERGAIKHKGSVKGNATRQGVTGEAGYERTRTEELAGGGKREHAHGGTVTAGAEGYGAAYKKSRTDTDEAGKTRKRETEVGVNLSERKVSATREIERRDAEGKKLGGASVGGSGQWDKETKGVGATGSYSQGDTKVGANLDAKLTASEPAELPDGSWAVDYNESLGGGLSVDQGKNKTAGVGAEGKVAHGGRRVFESKEEAEEFYKHPLAPHMAKRDPLALKVGEQLTEEHSGNVSLGGSATSGAFSVGAKAGYGKSSGQSITKLDEKTLEVVSIKGDEGSLGGSAGAGGFVGPSIGGSLSSAQSVRATYHFDISTDRGRAAFAQFQASGKAPKECLMSTALIDTKGSTLNGDSLFGGANRGGTMTKTTTITDNGVSVDHAGTGAKGAHIPFVGSFSASGSIDHNTLIAHAEGKGSGGGAAIHDELAESVGLPAHAARDDAKASGKWNVTSEMTNEQLVHFANSLCARDKTGNDKTVLAPLRQLDGAGADLQEQLRGAKSEQEIRKALAEFVKTAGPRGIAWMRQIGGVEDYDVALEGDQTFAGPEGRARIEEKMAKHTADAREGKADPAAIAKDLIWLRKKWSSMADDRKYTDLPPEMREHELTKLNGWIGRLSALEEQSAPASKSSPGGAASNKMFAESERAYGLLGKVIKHRQGGAHTPQADHLFDEAMTELGKAETDEQAIIQQEAKGAVTDESFTHATNDYESAVAKLMKAASAYHVRAPFEGMY